jgi:molecular chaperone GrpE
MAQLTDADMSTQDTSTPDGVAADAVAGAAAPSDQDTQTREQLMAFAAERIAALEAERDDYKDRWVRSEAEMANVRARAKRDADDARLFAVQKFARDVAEAAENLKRGLDSVPAPSEGEPAIVTKLRDGFEGVERSFVALLERNGIKREDPTGALFDPNLHQAMAEHETAEHPPGTVLQAWTQGWTLNGRLLRPAMVVVAKAAGGGMKTAAGAAYDTTA